MSLVIEEWMGMRLQTGWPMKEPWKLCKRSHGSTELNLPFCVHVLWLLNKQVPGAFSKFTYYAPWVHALWDWAGHEPSICDLWSETCYKWFERLLEYLSICLEKVFWINAWETTYSDFSFFFLFHRSLPLTFKKHYLLYHKTPKVQ